MSAHATQRSPGGRALFGALTVALLAVSSAALWIRVSRAPALTLSFWRLTYATALLLPFGARPALRGLRALSARERGLVALSGVALALHFAFWIASLAPSSPYATSVAASATLVAVHPALVAALSPWLSRRPAPRGAWVGIAFALLGAGVIAAGDARGAHRLAGDGLAFLGAVAGAAYFLLGARLRPRLSLLAYVLPVYATAALVLGALAAAFEQPLGGLGAREHALFLALAVLPMLVGHTLLNWALGHLPAWTVSATILAEPVASSVLVFVALGEAAPAASAAGAALVLTGLAAVTRASRAGAATSPRAAAPPLSLSGEGL
ncbi:MAG: DMT family transporter [Deltaproteobacteria bacterium]|nr:DMT family transporter [Deltaproteobacteria bacterium]